MEQQKQDAPSAKFQAAVATIWCGAIEDYVTIMVQNDWAAKCCWYAQHKDPAAGEGKRSKVGKKIKQMCEFLNFPLDEKMLDPNCYLDGNKSFHDYEENSEG